MLLRHPLLALALALPGFSESRHLLALATGLLRCVQMTAPVTLEPPAV